MISELKGSRDNLIRSEGKYRELADLLPDIIYESDMDLNITYLNNAGYSLTGYTEQDIQNGLSMSDLLSAEDSKIFLERVQDDKSRKFLSVHKIIRKDKSIIFGENNGSVMYEGEVPVGLRGSIRDVTDKLKMEEQIIQSQKMETIGTLAGGLAHDFNNVLAGLTSTLSIIRYEMDREKNLDMNKLSKHLTTMEKAGQRAVDMVQQLLTLSRRREAQVAPVNLNSTVEDVVKICTNTFDRCIDIKIEKTHEKAMAEGDPTQIEQVLLNLCVNASHAMTMMRPKGEPSGGRLIVSLDKICADEGFCSVHPESRKTDYWKLSVRDTGVGMDHNTLSKIFIPFFTMKERGTGTGLGLSMVYTIVQQHNGFIDVYSEPGVGSTFNVYLPVAHLEEMGEGRKMEPEVPRGEGLILVIDDEEVLRRTALYMLEKCGYEVITAENGEEGVRIFKERHHEIRAVLTDLVMPKKSGEQVYLEMKAINPEIKVLLTSGFKQDDRVNLALGYGIRGFIQKPYTLEKLSQAMADLLSGISCSAG
jgi:PAS domain S-box-containing protein